MLSKIREKIHDMLLYHIEPGSEGAKKSDHFNVFWDTLSLGWGWLGLILGGSP